jgi:hypothetical protein
LIKKIVNNKYLILIITIRCQTCSGELTQENSERTAENAETASAKWVSSESTTSSSAESVSESMLKSLDSPEPDDQPMIVY